MARISLVLLAAVAAATAENPYSLLLDERGVPATREGIADFLRRCVPNPGPHDRIALLIRRLSGPDAAGREDAARELSRIPTLPTELVKAAMEQGDPEVRRLCTRILKTHEAYRFPELIHAALQTIRVEPMKGLARLTLAALPHFRASYLRLSAQDAIVATAEPADLALLRSMLAAPSADARIAATRAIVQVRKNDAVAEVVPMLEDKDDAVRLAAAESLARLGRRESLVPLTELLASNDAAVRYDAGALLRAATGKSFGFVSYATEEKRGAATAAWKQFVDREGARLRPRHPLVVEARILGRTLVCAINQKRLVEYNRAGRVTFQSPPLAVPWGCQGLPNGHRLVAVFQSRVVIEYDEGGLEIWRSRVLPGKPMSVRRLPDGATLVACSDSGKVVEVSPRGVVVWSITIAGRPIDAQRVKNGLTLVTLNAGRRVVEVDRRGAITWQLAGAGMPSCAQRLGNGNTLVSGLEQHGTVSEYDRSGRVVWRLRGLETVYEAQRLRNGHTLVGTSKGVAEYNPHGRVVWQKNIGPCRVMRY